MLLHNAMSSMVRFAGLCLVLWAGQAVATTPVAASHDGKVLAAMEPFETLAETALTRHGKRIESAYHAAQANRAGARALLAEAHAGAFDVAFKRLDAANARQDHLEESLAASELYKQLALSLDGAAGAGALKQVNLLDYAGFRLSALLAAAAPDWQAIAATVSEANADWTAIRQQVANAKLQACMDDVQRRLAEAAARRDPVKLKPVIQQDLDLVDVLETYFARHKQTAGKPA